MATGSAGEVMKWKTNKTCKTENLWTDPWGACSSSGKQREI